MDGFKFRRQYSVNQYVIDFYCPELKLAIEIDGDSHFSIAAQRYDSERQKFIESFGIQFLRFVNNDIYENVDGVLLMIHEWIIKNRDKKHSSPLSPPRGGGDIHSPLKRAEGVK